MEAATAVGGLVPLQARGDLRSTFAYLQAPQRADYYQAIVRVFLNHARHYYQIYLSAEQITQQLTGLFGDYSAEKCRVDLDQLEAWGNVVKTFDTAQRHTTIESFLHPTVLYRATPATLEIEELYLRLEQRVESVGELRRGDLDHLVALFADVDRLVRDQPAAPQSEVLAETWHRLADQAESILDNTSKYIHTLAVTRQEVTSSELQGYLRYKQHVVAYVQDFALALQRVSFQLQRYLRDWEESGALDQLVAMLASHSPVPLLKTPSDEERREAALRQVGAVADWFRGPDWSEYFGRAARHEVNAVLQRAQLLAATAHLGAGFLVDLETLAQQLLRLTDLEAAASLTAVAFAHGLPRLLPERLTPSGDAAANPWAGEPPIRLTLQPIQRGVTTAPHEAPPVRDGQQPDEARRELLRQRRERLARLDRLFQLGDSDVAQLPISDDEDARAAVEVVRRCLLSAGQVWRAEDGTTIALLNPQESHLTFLRAPHAAYVLPWYRFRRSGRAGPNPLAPFPAREGGTTVGPSSPFPRREGGEGVRSGPPPGNDLS